MPVERSIVNATGVETETTGLEAREAAARKAAASWTSNSLPGGHSEWVPPDPIPNSEVKTLCADGSVPSGHARVGHRQASNRRAPEVEEIPGALFFMFMPRRSALLRCCRFHSDRLMHHELRGLRCLR